MVKALAKVTSSIGRSLMRCKPVAKTVMSFSRHKPEIMSVTGGMLIIGAFGWAIYESITVRDVMDETAGEVKALEAEYAAKSPEEQAAGADVHKKALCKVRIKGAIKVGKRYIGPGLALAGGLVLKNGALGVMRGRYVVAAASAKSYKDILDFYRGNVVKEQGKDADERYMHGITGEQVVTDIHTDDTGNKSMVAQKVPVSEGMPKNPWRFEFSDTYFSTYMDDVDRNIHFINVEQEWWNHELGRYDFVSMYDVLKHLGFRFEVMRDGMTKKQYREWLEFVRQHGWWKGSGKDEVIDLGVYRSINEPAITRHSDILWIEMNCDGNLRDMYKD